MHGEVRRVRGRADPDLVSGLDRGVEKTNGKQRQKYLIHFLYFLIPKPVPSLNSGQALVHVERSAIQNFLLLPDAYCLLDHFIRSHQHVGRNCETDLLRGFQIDDELELLGLLDGKFGRLSPFENFVHVGGGTPV
jgi:hypothetical protein